MGVMRFSGGVDVAHIRKNSSSMARAFMEYQDWVSSSKPRSAGSKEAENSVTCAYPRGAVYAVWASVGVDGGMARGVPATMGVVACELPLSIGLLLLSGVGGNALWAPRGYLFFAPRGLPFFLGNLS